MAEYRFFRGPIPYVSTATFHATRERAPHLEQDMHRDRLLCTAALITEIHPSSVVDLGCGDGGLLQVLGERGIRAWGYDFQPSNQPAWAERGVTAELRDVFNQHDVPAWGELAVLTEVLEHLADPHGTVEWVARHAHWVVASSPHSETPAQHAVEHAWAWDMDGYVALFDPYWVTVSHETVGWSQLYVGRNRKL
jgi:2-polyprenyl-3-methyl-5-hydroxy-6-metoxy-1,4-benzoquinol methylase